MNDTPSIPRDLARLALALLIAFAAIALASVYWSVIAAPDLRARDDNARNIIAEQRIQRGAILDRTGAVLAFSEKAPNGLRVRRYPQPVAASAVGYYSLTYGTAGIEAAYDTLLRGDEGREELETFLDDLLHRAPRGGDVRATLDLRVQGAVAEALTGRAGAAIVLDVPSGAVRALVSQPAFDPNTLDAQWDALVADRGAPLLNRVTAGLYQPGGVFQTVLLAALFAAQPDLSDAGAALLAQPAEALSEPVHVDDLTLGCLHQPSADTPTLADAYALGCPAPILSLAESSLSPESVRERMEALGLLDAPALTGFPTVTAPVTLPAAEVSPAAHRALLAGQGALTITPLHLAQIVAAIAHGGNAVPLHLVDAVRPPDSSQWQAPPAATVRERAMLRADVAAALESALAYAGRTSDTAIAALPDVPLFGHSALAFAGPQETPYAWFYGYVRPTGADGGAIVVVVVVENERNPAVAARVARAAFTAALQDSEPSAD